MLFFTKFLFRYNYLFTSQTEFERNFYQMDSTFICPSKICNKNILFEILYISSLRHDQIIIGKEIPKKKKFKIYL